MNILLPYVVTFAVAVSMSGKLSEAKPLLEHHVNHRRLRQARIRAIQQEILSKLGLTHVPETSKLNATVDEVRRMYKLYRQSIEDNKGRVHSLYAEEEFYAKTFHSFTDDGTPPLGTSTHWQSAASHLLNFPVDIPMPAEPNKETVVYSAALKLYKLRTRVPPWWLESAGETVDEGPTARINIYQLLEPRGGGNSGSGGGRSRSRGRLTPPRKRLLDSRLVTLDGSGWEEFNVKPALRDWIENPGTNYGLEVVCVSCVLKDTIDFALPGGTAAAPTPATASATGTTSPPTATAAAAAAAEAEAAKQGGLDGGSVLEQERIFQAGMEEEQEQDVAPRLNVYTQDRLILGRQKRSSGADGMDCQHGDGETRCCRYRLRIDFAEIGWDSWIIAPTHFDAYFCGGSCPQRYRSAHTFAKIQSILHQVNPAAAPEPCCAATKLMPVQVMHLEGGQVKLASFEDMVVGECKCA